jgi:hypothetical protein
LHNFFFFKQLFYLLHIFFVKFILINALILLENHCSGLVFFILFLDKILVKISITFSVSPFITVELWLFGFMRNIIVLGVPDTVVKDHEDKDD